MATHFVVGDFRDGRLVEDTICRPEWGLDFYAPQTFQVCDRRIIIGWMYHWGKSAPAGCEFAGALSIPRELTWRADRICNYPVAEARNFLKTERAFVKQEGNQLILSDRHGQNVIREIPENARVEILEDTKSIEVFVNGGEISFTQWLE